MVVFIVRVLSYQSLIFAQSRVVFLHGEKVLSFRIVEWQIRLLLLLHLHLLFKLSLCFFKNSIDFGRFEQVFSNEVVLQLRVDCSRVAF